MRVLERTLLRELESNLKKYLPHQRQTKERLRGSFVYKGLFYLTPNFWRLINIATPRRIRLTTREGASGA